MCLNQWQQIVACGKAVKTMNQCNLWSQMTLNFCGAVVWEKMGKRLRYPSNCCCLNCSIGIRIYWVYDHWHFQELSPSIYVVWEGVGVHCIKTKSKGCKNWKSYWPSVKCTVQQIKVPDEMDVRACLKLCPFDSKSVACYQILV